MPKRGKNSTKKLVHWELQLEEAPDSAMNELLRTQKEEANAAFTKFVRRNYESWVQHPDAEDTPLLSPMVMRKTVLPKLKAGKTRGVGGARQFPLRSVAHAAKALANDFDIDEQLYYAILPTVTQYARNALFAGLMPLELKQQYPPSLGG